MSQVTSPAPPAEKPRLPVRPDLRELLIGGAHLAGLWAIAMAQPLLDLLGNSPEFFVARGNTAADILILVVGFTFLPPLVLLGLEALVSRIGRAPYKWLHLGLVTILAAFFFVQVEKRIFQDPTVLIIALALALGAGVAYGLSRTRFVRGLLDVLAAAPIVFLVVFVFFSGSSKLVLPQAEADPLGGEIRSDTPVVALVFDELPTATLMDGPSSIHRERFPGFADIADSSTWYINHTTVADFSGRAVPALLTGIEPTGRELPIAADQPRSIFTLLGGAYELNVHESITELCPDSLCPSDEADAGAADEPMRSRLRALYEDLKYVQGRLVLPPEIAESLPNVSTTFGDFGIGDDVRPEKRAGQFVRDIFEPPSPEELQDFVDQIPAGGRTLSLNHMELPHEPFQFLPEGRKYNATELSNLNSVNAQEWDTDQHGVATVEARHYLQTAYADRLVQAMISRLKEVGIWEEAMVIVTSDHGISFEVDLPRRVAFPENLGGIANPPLFIKMPGQDEAQISQKPVRTTDIVPTIAEALNVAEMYESDGKPISEVGEDREVIVANGMGETITAPISDVVSQRNEVIRKASERLGDGGIDELGPAPELIGRSVPAPSGEGAELDQPDLLGDLDPDAEPFPSFVTGELDELGAGETIAISANGEVAATTPSFEYHGEVRFGAVLPPERLVEGYNPIGVFRVTEGGELEPLGGA